jgi:hypothetical protein
MKEKIIVKNFTTLADFSALIRAGMYLAGYEAQAVENGFYFCVRRTQGGKTVVEVRQNRRVV